MLHKGFLSNNAIFSNKMNVYNLLTFKPWKFNLWKRKCDNRAENTQAYDRYQQLKHQNKISPHTIQKTKTKKKNNSCTLLSNTCNTYLCFVRIRENMLYYWMFIKYIKRMFFYYSNFVFYRIMVLDNGKIIQFDTPENLLQHPGGLFYQLAKDSGII